MHRTLLTVDPRTIASMISIGRDPQKMNAFFLNRKRFWHAGLNRKSVTVTLVHFSRPPSHSSLPNPPHQPVSFPSHHKVPLTAVNESEEV